MKKLLEKIRRILRDRRTRRLLTRTVSAFAAVVVFITTYALVLPAITMEIEADCGIEAHQHDASCYEDVLICEEEESDGHHHDDSCYTSTTELECEIPEHTHDETCYDEEGNLICEQPEHTHDDTCYVEHRELTCGLEESDGHHHDSSCYEQVLVCGKEVHVHSEACYHNGDAEAEEEADAMAVMSDAAYTGASASSADEAEPEEYEEETDDGENAGTDETDETDEVSSDMISEDDSAADYADEMPSETADSDINIPDTADTAGTAENASDDAYVPTLDPLTFEWILNKDTEIYYYHVEDDETIEDSSVITDWEKVDQNTKLGRNDLLRVYLAYTIPAGSLNTTNDTARYRLPSNLHLTDGQVKAINEIENGAALQYINYDNLEVTDTENYHKYLGAEAVEGTRTPADDASKYLAEHDGQEYISAVVKAENIYNDQNDYLGQDLIFTFTPYSVQKNQHEYDIAGQPTKAGETIKGWFTLDFNMEQVDWNEPEITTYETSEEEANDLPAGEAQSSDIAVDTVDAANDNDTADDNGTTDDTDSADSEDAFVETDSTDNAENAENTAHSSGFTKVTTIERTEQTADIVFVHEGTDAQNNQIQEIHTELTLVEESRTESIADNTTPDEATDETGEEAADTSEEAQEETDQPDDAAADEMAETAEPAAEPSEELPDEEKEDSSPEYKAGTLTSEGTGYKITLDYKADAQIPENAYLKVSEITRESDPEAYEACLKEAEKTIPTDNKTTVDDKASRFFDIEIFVDEQVNDQTADQDYEQPAEESAEEENTETASGKTEPAEEENTETVAEKIEPAEEENTETAAEKTEPAEEENRETVSRKIEPEAPVKVNIQLFDTEVSENVDKFDAEQYKVIHFAEKGTEEIQDVTAQTIDADQKQEHSANNNTAADAPAIAPPTEVQFETDSFSIYGVVYTVDFHAEVITASGDTYEITVKYEADAKIPDGAELRVREILPEDDEYKTVQEKADEKLTDELKEVIPGHPVLFDIAIVVGGKEIEPAEGSSVDVEIKLVRSAVKGMYSDEESPVLINDMPVSDETSEINRDFKVLHIKGSEEIDVMKTEDTISEEEVVSGFTTDSFSNWLLFLDEDLSRIDITTGDSLTLRPYTEWVWKKDAELDEYKNVSWTFPSTEWDSWQANENVGTNQNPKWVTFTYYRHKTNGSVFRSFEKEDTELKEKYIVVTSQEIHAGTFNLRTTKGKVINVNVTTGSGSHKPGTVDGIADLKVNLFDYDVPGNGNNYDFTKSGNLDTQSNVASNPDNNYNSNGERNINYNHDLKFLGYGGSNATAERDWFWINDYTNAVPSQGIVKNNLDSEGYPVLGPSTGGQERGNPNLKYLFDPESQNHNVYAFENAGGLFRQDNHGFYYYNSNVNYAEYNQSTNSFTLYEHTYSQNTGGSYGANAKPIGFYPFHEYDTVDTQPEMNFNKNLNHHFGMSMSVDFEIPKDRKAEFDGEKYDIIYEFSGDDDLWVFIDDELVLDIGGIHQPVTGRINFTTGEVTVYGVNDGEPITKSFSVGAHTMKMFYIERGGCDSNLSVKFNLPLVKGKASLDVAKKSMASDTSRPDQFLPGALFGVWENEDCSGEPYLTATSDSNGHVDFGYLPVKHEGQKFYIKEIAPPDGFLLNMAVYTATASEKDEDDNYILTVTDGNGVEIEKIQQEPYYPIIRDGRPDPIDLSVEKRWQNADGTQMANPSGTAVFELKRVKTYTREIPQDPVPSGEITVRAGRVQPSGSWQTTVLDTGSIKRGTNATITWSYPSNYHGQKQYRYSTNKGEGNNWTYSAQNLPYSGSAQIAVPASSELWVFFYDEWNSAVSVSISGEPDQAEQDPLLEIVTEPDDEFSQTMTLPTSGGAWSDTFRNLIVAEQSGDRVYYYSYYIVEKTVPEGFEAVYYDGNNHEITDPSSQATNLDNQTQIIANRQLMDVPLTKTWEDFSDEEFTWTASFQLEQRELKVNASDPDASDAITEWEPVDGKTLTISKGQNASFEGLPRFRVHSNGTVYRILYSVAETSYEVKEGNTIVATWDEEHGHTIGHKYTPQFYQDAGGNEQGEKPYEIILANTLHQPTITNDIDLSIEKKWKAGNLDYNPGENATASFVLKRYVHEEYRNYSHVEDMTDMVTITLDVAGTGTDPTITVPRGAMVSIEGNVLARQNATIEFTRADGTLLSKTVDNSSSQSLKSFDISFEATQDETVRLTRGENYVSGGRDGFRLTDHGDQSAAKLDKHFEERFTLPENGNWIKDFYDLPQIEEDEMDEVSHVQTITVYTYFFEEESCTPAYFDPVFKTTTGQLLGDANNPVDTSHDLIAENQARTGALKIIKNVTVDEEPASGLPDNRKTLADGTYTFRIYEADGVTVAKKPGSTVPLDDITITISNGESNWSEVTGLIVGEYVVKEVGSDNPYVSLDTGNHTVTVSQGEAATVEATASITNDYVTTGITVQKKWQKADGTDDNSKTGDITFTLIQNAYTYNAETGEAIEEMESAVTAYHGKYNLKIGDDDAESISDNPSITFSSDKNVSVSDLPLYGYVNGTPVKYEYSVRETSIDGYSGIETQDEEGNWTIVNRPAAETDRDTDLTVTKLWKDKDDNPATLQGDESIEFVLRQKAVKTDYVPVTIRLFNPNAQTEAASKTIYIKKGTALRYYVNEETILGTTHYVYVSVNNAASVQHENGTSHSVIVTGPTTINASIGTGILSRLGRWAQNPWSNNNVSTYRWIFDYSSTEDKIESIDDLIAQYATETDGVTISEFRYQMTSNSIHAETDTIGEAAANDFIASFTKLPLFKQVGEDSYTYYYSVSEVKVNGAVVVDDQTEDYVVSYDHPTDNATVITNTEKEKISVSADKTWTNADGTRTPPEGSSVTFELYRDDQPTGKTVVLNGKIDVADDEHVVDAATHEKNTEAIEAKAYESAAWTATWENLNKYKEDGTTEYIYTIHEVSGYTGYAAESDSAAAGGAINNVQVTTSLDIVKVDSLDNTITLEGAKFTIRKIKDTLGANDIEYDGAESSPVTTEDDGKAKFEGITYGYYEVRETLSPDGYVLPGDACFYIRFDDNGLKLLEKDLSKDPKEWHAHKIEVGHVTLTDGTAEVKNEPGAELPSTGGPGTRLFTILGSILILGAGIRLWRRRRLT